MIRVCKVCGKAVPPGRKTTCSVTCARNHTKAYNASKYRKIHPTEKNCPICSKLFPVLRGRKFCSDNCAEVSDKAGRKTRASIYKVNSRKYHAEKRVRRTYPDDDTWLNA